MGIITHQPKYMQVKDLIVEKYLQNASSKGSFLPPESELMKNFEVSRNTIRMALKNLREERVIITRQGQKSQINTVPPSSKHEMKNIAWVDLEYVGTDGVYFEIFKFINSLADKREANVDYVNLQFKNASNDLLKSLKKYDGIIITGRIMKNKIPKEIFDCLSSMNNVVAIDNVSDLPTGNIIGTDNYTGARMAVELLVRTNHKKVVFLGIAEAFHRYSPFAERLRGYKDMVAEQHLPQDNGLTVVSAEMNDTFDVRPVLERTLKKHPDIDAFFAITDFIAIQTLYALKGMDIKVPYDISVIGFDGLQLGEAVSPRLTTICQPFAEIASLALEHLLGVSAKTSKTFGFLPVAPYLISRESVKNI